MFDLESVYKQKHNFTGCYYPDKIHIICSFYRWHSIHAYTVIALIITYYGLILYDIQVCDLRMEINQASGDQLI